MRTYNVQIALKMGIFALIYAMRRLLLTNRSEMRANLIVAVKAMLEELRCMLIKYAPGQARGYIHTRHLILYGSNINPIREQAGRHAGNVGVEKYRT
jgi:hypothetical protein